MSIDNRPSQVVSLRNSFANEVLVIKDLLIYF